ncbi:tyrosine-type recombinase/integrase [Chryseobacterium suipulveris]|uniref:Tyrosine-type recombinase/integrase n=1 Tax=Chryseobacterium suipulveris TaxID=2929800 RepID=A0ABY4BM94_9FLAO|nr:tyrosine-type recombinase/integrase [Chryseobacterium suipulveris]UOE40312.1 tyrosine-type recombinase/integrase [Chryseobacterium suipulveris]
MKYCIEVKDHSANTIHRDVGMLKTFLYWALNNKYTYNNDFIQFKKPPKFRTDEIALNYQQVEQIYNHDFSKNKKLERVRDLFVFGCTSGMRFGNYSAISREDIQDGFIRVIDLKSKSKSLAIPLNSISKAILEKYDYELPRISNQKMNEYIKDVFKELEFTEDIKKTMKYGDELVEKTSKFWERISSHTARRSFITIMKNNRVPDKVIMSYTGHTSLEVFNTYYRPSEEDKINYMNEVFK